MEKSKNKVYKEELERIHRSKGLTPQNVVETARDKKNPLHDYFDWNDSTAAEGFRIRQARDLINSIKIRIDSRRVPAFENIKVTIKKKITRKYYPVVEIFATKPLREALLLQALRELDSFQRRYDRFQELMPIFTALKKVKKKWNKK